MPIRVAPQTSYTGRIEGPRGTVVEIDSLTSSDGKGNFELVCPRELFAAGPHVLVVEKCEQRRKKPTETFRFPFEVA